jgi:hypothetical protein
MVEHGKKDAGASDTADKQTPLRPNCASRVRSGNQLGRGKRYVAISNTFRNTSSVCCRSKNMHNDLSETVK